MRNASWDALAWDISRKLRGGGRGGEGGREGGRARGRGGKEGRVRQGEREMWIIGREEGGKRRKNGI